MLPFLTACAPLCRQQVFESAEQFDEWFNLDIDDNDEKNKLISQLHKILKPFVLRRLKADVERSLPPKHETILFTGMSAMQKKLYRDILQRDIEAIRGTSGSRTAILNIVMQVSTSGAAGWIFFKFLCATNQGSL